MRVVQDVERVTAEERWEILARHWELEAAKRAAEMATIAYQAVMQRISIAHGLGPTDVIHADGTIVRHGPPPAVAEEKPA